MKARYKVMSYECDYEERTYYGFKDEEETCECCGEVICAGKSYYELRGWISCDWCRPSVFKQAYKEELAPHTVAEGQDIICTVCEEPLEVGDTYHVFEDNIICDNDLDDWVSENCEEYFEEVPLCTAIDLANNYGDDKFHAMRDEELFAS